MKTHTIKTPTAELLIVEAKDDNIAWAIVFHKYGARAVADYTLLGKPDEIKEEDAMELVERIGEGNPSYQGDWYVNYQDDEFMFETAKESLLSLIESEIYWENPFPYERTESEIMADNLKNCRFMTKEESKFWEAEQKTFDRQRSLIFKKVTQKI